MVSREAIIAALQTVDDPELHVDIWTLGLVYDIKIADDGGVEIIMTLTTPTCPFGPLILQMIELALKNIGVATPVITLNFDKPWRAPANLRAMLGL